MSKYPRDSISFFYFVLFEKHQTLLSKQDGDLKGKRELMKNG
jgi:hypothetical protein